MERYLSCVEERRWVRAYALEDAILGTSISLFITLIYVPFNKKSPNTTQGT